MLEIWGMHKMVRVLEPHLEPRQVGTRAFGRAVPALISVSSMRPIATCQTVSRRNARCATGETRAGVASSGFFKDAAAIEAAWRGRWPTPAMWSRGPDGMLRPRAQEDHHPPERREIAAAEVEAVLLTLPMHSRPR